MAFEGLVRTTGPDRGATQSKFESLRLEKTRKVCSEKSGSGSQGNENLNRDLAGYGKKGKTYSSQEAVQPSQGNIKYNICTGCDQDVAQQSAKDDGAPTLAALLVGDSFAQRLNGPLEPSLVEIGDDCADDEAGRDRPAEERETDQNPDAAEREEKAANAGQSAVEKGFRENGRGLWSRRGHLINVSQINSSAA